MQHAEDYDLSKDDLLLVLEGGDVNFDLSNQDGDPCQYFVIENNIKGKDLVVEFEYCFKPNTVRVMTFTCDNESVVCDF